MSERQALTGLRILDFTQVLAGPFATQQMAQLGADVVKIEARGVGDFTRGLLSSGADGMAPSFLSCNLGKRSLTLDLKHPKAQEIVFKLVETSDALVENFKPGTIERLGFGYEAVRAIKPDIVYASISGYGQAGPKSELPAFDGAIQAASGMMSISGHPESGPVRTGYFSVDMSTALNAAFAVTAALFRRHVTGEGQRIDVSMMDSAFVMQAAQISNYLVNDTRPDLMGNASPTKQPTANVFATSDGFIQVIGLRDTQARALMKVVGREDLFEAHPEPVDRVKASDEFNAVLQPAMAEHTTQHWLGVLQAAGVPAAPIHDVAQAATDEQVAHRLSLTEIAAPGAQDKTVKVVSSGHMAQPAPPRVQRPPPQLGEHTEEVLAELGYTAADIDALKKDGAI
jgi:crotonobetainyl-CoA:carnitine CoA-transferase CaiB-like acyl-CoA transferase